MAPRECVTCGSTKWRKASGAALVCGNGHALTGYRNELREDAGSVPYAMRKRTLTSQRKTKGRVPKSDPLLYYGPRARAHYFQCLQLLLRKQIACLTKLWCLPPEFEKACRDIWKVHLASLPVPLSPEPLLYRLAQTPRPREQQVHEVPEHEMEARSSPLKPQVNRPEKVPPNFHDDDHLEDLLEELSDLEDYDTERARSVVPPPRVSFYARRRQNMFEVPASNVAILAVACWSLRIPIIYMDLIKLLESHAVPYLEPLKHLPENMARHLTKHTIQAVTPQHPPTVLKLHALASRLAKLMQTRCCIHIPHLNEAPVLWRTTQALCGTPTLYLLAKSLSARLQTPLTLTPSLAPTLRSIHKARVGIERARTIRKANRKNSRYDPIVHKKDGTPPEVAMAAAIILILKWVYGLDGTTLCREPDDPSDPYWALPKRRDYLKAVEQELAHTPIEDQLLSHNSKMTALNMTDSEIDVYLDWCGSALLNMNRQKQHKTRDEFAAKYFPFERATEGTGPTPDPLQAFRGDRPVEKQAKRSLPDFAACLQPYTGTNLQRKDIGDPASLPFAALALSPARSPGASPQTPSLSHPGPSTTLTATRHDHRPGNIHRALAPPQSYALVLALAARFTGVRMDEIADLVDLFERRIINEHSRKERAEKMRRSREEEAKKKAIKAIKAEEVKVKLVKAKAKV